MRILHITDRVSPRGGAYWHMLGVLEALRDSGHDVHLAAGAREPGLQPRCAVSLVPGLEARGRASAQLSPVMERFRPDVLHLHTVVNPAVLEWAAGRPAVITVQDHRYFCPGRGKWTAGGEPCRTVLADAACRSCFSDDAYFRELLQLTRERLAAVARLRVVVLSRYMAAELAAAGVPAERMAVVPPFVHELEAAAAPDGPPCVLFVGRLTEAKGVRDAVRAWRLSGVPLPLVAAGTGPLRAELEAEGVEVLGWIDRARLAATYRRAAAVLLPSRWQEPFGIAGLEASSLGVPVVAWDSGGVGEWLPGPAVPWSDVEGLARALRTAVAGGDAGTGRTPRGRDRDALMSRLMKIYGDIC